MTRLVKVYFPLTYSLSRDVFLTVIVERDEPVTSAAFGLYHDDYSGSYFTIADWYNKTWLSIGI